MPSSKTLPSGSSPRRCCSNSENKYRVLFEDSADANWLMDEKGFLDAILAALQMFGYSAGTACCTPPISHPEPT